jgi:NAD(P)-dependent dehydrogenase (short-subunit alcohol dehydrogenase family)
MFGAPIIGMVLLGYTICYFIAWLVTEKLTKNNKSFSSVLEAAVAEATQQQQSPIELAVVITGCDSGFGKDLVKRLANEGFVVFAGCLLESSVQSHFNAAVSTTGDSSIVKNGKIYPVLLDVTNEEQVQTAKQVVQDWLKSPSKSTKSQRYLHAIVNNAGIGKIGYIDWIDLTDYEQCMDVNCYGHIRMVKAFLPILKSQAVQLLKEKKNSIPSFYAPQIMNVISMAGTSRGGLALTPYEVSKTAAGAFTDGLRIEMKMWNVRVIDINPSFHTTALTTNIYDKLQKELWTERVPVEMKQEYGQGTFVCFLYLRVSYTSRISCSNSFFVSRILRTLRSTC